MAWSFNARLTARVVGVPVVMLACVAAFVGLAFSPLTPWLLGPALVILGIPICALAIRFVRGENPTTTDVEVTRDRISISGIPSPIALAVLTRGLSVFARQPLPLAEGYVRGGPPSNETSLVRAADAALPPSAEVTQEPLKIPDDARPLPPPEGR